MLQKYHYNLAIRFVSDYNLPISICSDPEIFEYELQLFEDEYLSLSKWNNLINNIEKYYNGDADLFLSEYKNIRNIIIETIKNTEIFKEFNNDINGFKKHTNIIYPQCKSPKSIYNQENLNQTFISIDMKNANFQALKYANIISDKAYTEFISNFCEGFMLDYISESKYSRQVIFGQICPKHTVALEKYLVVDLYNNIIKKYYDTDVMCVNSDEIIIKISTDENETEMFNKLVDEINKYSPICYRIEKFKLIGYNYFIKKPDASIHKIGEFYKKIIFNKGYTYKGIPLNYQKIIYKLLNNKSVIDKDKIFLHDSFRVLMLDELLIEQM